VHPTTPAGDGWLRETLDGLRQRSGAVHEVEALHFLGDRIDDALEDRRLDRCAALLEALNVGELADDVALTALIATLPARLALRSNRVRYADRVRAELAARDWTTEDLTAAIDDLL
jgi:hypothetical protein